MNVTIPHAKTGPWLPLLFALIGASALGIGAGLGTASLIDSQWQLQYNKLAEPSTATIAPTSGASMVVYLVDTPEQESWVIGTEQVAALDRAAGNADATYAYRILTMTAPDADATLAQIKQAWSTHPEGLQVVDMRTE